MGSVVQHKSAVATTQSVSVTLDSPVTLGNLLVVFIARFGVVDAIAGFDEDNAPSWTTFESLGTEVANGQRLDVYANLAQANESYTLTVEFQTNTGLAKAVHLFEISGYTTLDKQNFNSQTTATPSISLGQNTSFNNELVLVAFLDGSHIGETFSTSSGFTAGESTNTGVGSMFTEYTTLSAIGNPTAATTIQNSDAVCSIMLTLYDVNDEGGTGGSGGSGGGGTSPSGTVFLGSVRVLGSAPAGRTNPFLGTVKVISSAPSGVPNPYLGSIAVGSPSGSQTNPSLGEVLIVADVPAGATDVFWGSVEETS
jgi:hypothetical protein